MKKTILFLIVGVLLVSPVYATCSEENVFKRLISKCKTLDDGICDDGEYLLNDKDCSIFIGNKLRNFIFDMWFIKLLLAIGTILYFKGNPNYPLLFFIVILLLVLSGGFGTFETPTISENVKPFITGAVNDIGEDSDRIDNAQRILTVIFLIISLFLVIKIIKNRSGKK